MSLQAISVVFVIVGTLLILVSLRNLLRAKFFSGSSGMLFGIALMAIAAACFLVATNLHTYSRLTYEQPVAELIFKNTGPQQYQCTLIRTPSGAMQIFAIKGDEWQLDARVLKWRGWVNMLGLDAQFRLERLSGRYLNIDMERAAPRTVYGLTDNPGLDLWNVAIDHQSWVPFVDATYGSATFLPMADGARFRISLSQSGLIARPLNATATDAVDRWPRSNNDSARP